MISPLFILPNSSHRFPKLPFMTIDLGQLPCRNISGLMIQCPLLGWLVGAYYDFN